MKNLAGQVVLITGGGSGIGRLMAKNFAQEKSRVVLWDINEAALNKVVDEIRETGGDASGYVCDVSEKETTT